MEPIKSNSNSVIQSFQSTKVVETKPEESALDIATASPKFISPIGRIDAKAGTYTTQFRDTSTGEVQSEFPRKVAAYQYAKAAVAEQQNPASAQNSAAPAPSEATSSADATKASGTDVEA